MDGARERDQATPDGGDDRSYTDETRKQERFAQLLEEHDGDFQAATDAMLRDEEPEEEPEGRRSA